MQACFLVGCTAVGKSSVAQWIAEHEGHDILSADSMLVYKGMDVGTAKPTEAERGLVNYGGIDLVSPSEQFSVWDYQTHARQFMGEVQERGHKSIVTGGSGLYMKALTDGLDEGPGFDPQRREHWSACLEEKGLDYLLAELKAKSEDVYDSLVDKSNPRRVIRALEKAEGGIVDAPVARDEVRSKMLGLRMPAEQLKTRIGERVKRMYTSGLEDEAKGLVEQYGSLSITASQAIGYAEVMDVIGGRCSREEAVERTAVRTRRLAKRQATWFRHQADVEWIEIDDKMTVEEVAVKVMSCWMETEIRMSNTE